MWLFLSKFGARVVAQFVRQAVCLSSISGTTYRSTNPTRIDLFLNAESGANPEYPGVKCAPLKKVRTFKIQQKAGNLQKI